MADLMRLASRWPYSTVHVCKPKGSAILNESLLSACIACMADKMMIMSVAALLELVIA